jgi:hypothetical protein
MVMQWYTNVQYTVDKMQNYPMDSQLGKLFFTFFPIHVHLFEIFE